MILIYKDINWGLIALIAFTILIIILKSSSNIISLDSFVGGLIVSIIFYLINDYFPHFNYRMSRYKYINVKMQQIQEILQRDINRPFQFYLKKESLSISNFIDSFVSQINKNNSILNNYIENCHKVHLISEELLVNFGAYLKLSQQKKLEYFLHHYKVNPLETIDFIDISKDILDDNLLKLRAYSIYKAYILSNSKGFKIPHFSEEDQIIRSILHKNYSI